MKRNIKKQVWLNREEAEMLRKKSKKACLTEAALIRFLLKGYLPREKPGQEFYSTMARVTDLTDAINKVASKLNDKDEISRKMLQAEIKSWHKIQSEIEKKYLIPEEDDALWQ